MRAAFMHTDAPPVIGEETNTRQRSEEHTSELQSHLNLVCRLLLEKKNKFESLDVKANSPYASSAVPASIGSCPNMLTCRLAQCYHLLTQIAMMNPLDTPRTSHLHY